MIELEGVSKSYDGGGTFAVRDLDLRVGEGEWIALLGGSGSGKSTTLKTINRMVEPTAGRVRVAGRDVQGTDPVALRRSMGYVFQGIGLFPHMTVAENVAVTLRLLGESKADALPRVNELLEVVGLDPGEHSERRPRSLSGGEQQRVGVARALAARPRILLMDEPFGALDPITRTGLQGEMAALREKLDLTVVLVTHDVTEAMLLADRVVVLATGRLVADGTPRELLSSPPNEYTRALVNTPKEQARRLESLASDEGISR